MHHSMEIVLFSLVSFLPYLLLEIFAFRRSLRFSVSVTTVCIVAVSILQIVIGLWIAPKAERSLLTAIGTLLSGVVFILTIKDGLGKKLFMFLMIANDANLVVAATECIEVHSFSDLATCAYHWSYSLVMLGMELLVLSPMFFYVRRVYAQKRQLKAWSYLWLIPLTFYIVWVLLFRFETRSLLSPEYSVQFLFVTLMLCLGGIFVYMMVWQFLKEHQQNEELREKEYMLTMQQTQYANLHERIEEARRMKHDLRHHIRVVSAYLKDGKLEELKAYLQNFSDAMPDDSRISYCDHYAANALLMYFAWQAKEIGADYHVAIDLPTKVGIANEALTVVLGNLLENAVAACREEPKPARIDIRGRKDDSAVFFQITNTCSKPVKKTATGKYISTKPGGQGIGLSSVENITCQYDGILEVVQKDNKFAVSVMLTIPESKPEYM